MVEPASAAAGALAKLPGAGLVTEFFKKVYGPTWEAMGELKVAEWRMANADRIAEVTLKRLGDKAGSGYMNPRVAMKLVTEGSWYDASIAAEYFGGIAASSWSEDPQDDRMATWATRLSQLVANDILLHHLIYAAIREVYSGQHAKRNLGDVTARMATAVYLPASELAELFNLPPVPDGGENDVVAADLLHSVQALATTALIDGTFNFGLGRLPTGETAIGLWIAPSMDGILLMNFVYGHPLLHYSALLNPSIPYDPVVDPAPPRIEKAIAIGHLGNTRIKGPEASETDETETEETETVTDPA